MVIAPINLAFALMSLHSFYSAANLYWQVLRVKILFFLGREVGRGSPSLLEDSVTRPVAWNHLTTTPLHPALSRESLPSMRAPPEMGAGSRTLAGACTVSHLRLRLPAYHTPQQPGVGALGDWATPIPFQIEVSASSLCLITFFFYLYWDMLDDTSRYLSLRCACVHTKSLQSCLTLCDPMDCSLTRLLCPWDFPGKSTGVGCRFLLQGVFPARGSHLHLLCHALAGGFFTTSSTWVFDAHIYYEAIVT